MGIIHAVVAEKVASIGDHYVLLMVVVKGIIVEGRGMMDLFWFVAQIYSCRDLPVIVHQYLWLGRSCNLERGTYAATYNCQD